MKPLHKKLIIYTLALLFSTLIAQGSDYLFRWLQLYKIPQLTSIPINFSLFTLLIVLAIVIIYKLFLKKDLEEGMKTPKTGNFKSAFYFFALLFPIALFGRLLIPQFDIDYYSANNLGTALVPFLIIMLFFVIKEELVERSLIQGSLMKYINPLLLTFAISINFAMMHLTWFTALGWKNTLALVLSVFFGAFLLTALYNHTKNIYSTLFLHLMVNFLVLFQIILHVKSYYVVEIIFWLAWGLIFFIFLSPSFNILKKTLTYTPQSSLDWTFIIIYALIWPLVFTLLL